MATAQFSKILRSRIGILIPDSSSFKDLQRNVDTHFRNSFSIVNSIRVCSDVYSEYSYVIAVFSWCTTSELEGQVLGLLEDMRVLFAQEGLKYIAFLVNDGIYVVKSS